ncbi:MAG: ribonuclease III [Oscillospiraceae bacterium]|nr:ribonuclease III [Oscillospiraceae bacterium]
MDELNTEELQKKLGYVFNDQNLLIKSLTHSSYANEGANKHSESNERLEFLGDSLLGMSVALLIYKSKPELSEGQMTKLRAQLVCEKSLAALALQLDLGEYLLLGRGEQSGGGRSRPSILADALEAVIAAVYLDGGYEPVENLIASFFSARINAPIKSVTDFKTQLQEMIQCKSGQTLAYELKDVQGPDHQKLFTVEVKRNGKTIGTGTGKSKKNAEQEAAKAAVDTINKERHGH